MYIYIYLLLWFTWHATIMFLLATHVRRTAIAFGRVVAGNGQRAPFSCWPWAQHAMRGKNKVRATWWKTKTTFLKTDEDKMRGWCHEGKALLFQKNACSQKESFSPSFSRNQLHTHDNMFFTRDFLCLVESPASPYRPIKAFGGITQLANHQSTQRYQPASHSKYRKSHILISLWILTIQKIQHV